MEEVHGEQAWLNEGFDDGRECGAAVAFGLMAMADAIGRRAMDISRRSRIDLFSPAEKAIWEAVQAVEAMPPDVRLTQAQNKLHEARALVADFVDGVALPNGAVPGDAPKGGGT